LRFTRSFDYAAGEHRRSAQDAYLISIVFALLLKKGYSLYKFKRAFACFGVADDAGWVDDVLDIEKNLVAASGDLNMGTVAVGAGDGTGGAGFGLSDSQLVVKVIVEAGFGKGIGVAIGAGRVLQGGLGAVTFFNGRVGAAT
jgi:hypothetical protein